MKKIWNSICVVLAFVCMAIGAIGVIVPLLPTTPFLLLSLMLFAKGSKRFHQWFMGTLLYKKYLETYVSTKTMPIHTKRNVLITVSILFTFGFIFSPVLWARIVIVIVWIGHFYFFIFRMKTTESSSVDEVEIQKVSIQDKKKQNKRKKIGIKLFSFFFTVGFLVYFISGGWSNEDLKSWPQVKADSVIADGVYSISVSLWHATNDAASMGNGALDQSGKLVVQDGEGILYLHLKNFSYYGLTGNLMQLDLLTDISYNQNNYPSSYQLLNSTVVSTYATVDEYNAADSTDVNCAGKLYPKVASIPVTINTEYMWSHVYVPIMGSLGFGDQLCRIKLDYSSLTAMSEEEIQLWKEYETSDTAQTEDDTDNGTDNGSDNENIVTVDKSALKTKLEEANSFVSQTDVYTAVTITKLTSVIATAQTVYDNTSATQAIVNAQITALQDAINDLVKKSSENLDKDNLGDGKYNVYLALWHATSDQESMGNAALNHTALLTVKNGVYTLDVSTHPITVGTITACLQSLQIKQTNESYTYASVTANNNTLDGVKMPSIFSFTLPSKEEYISVKIDPQVAVMGTDPLPARLKISWDTLTLVAEDSTVEENTETTTGGLNSPSVNLKDSTTGIKIKAAKNILVSGVSMKVSEIASGTNYTTIQSLLSTVGSDFVAYDIFIYNTEGTVVEPNGMVSVYIPIPDDYDSDSIAIYRVTDSAKTKLTTTIEDGYAVFQTNSFSMFALVDTSSLTKSSLPVKKTETLTKKSTSSSSSTKKSNLTGANETSVQTNQKVEEVNEESPVPVIIQIQQDENSLQPDQIITLVLVVVAIAGSMVIMLFIIGFVLMDSLLKRRK